MPTDLELLSSYLAQGQTGEAAFAELVRRHTQMVFSVCYRVLGETTAAEDAAQATFLLLSRKARQVFQSACLAGWLYRTAELTARNAKRSANRRARLEKEMGIRKESTPDAAWEQVMPLLDAALAKLPEAQREVVLQRYLYGRSEAEACQELGLERSVLSVRLSRALASLREKLRGHGASVSGGGLSTYLAQYGVGAVPPEVFDTLQAVALGQAEASPAALHYLEGANQAMWWAKAQSVALGTAALLICATVPFIAGSVQGGDAPAPQGQAAAGPVAPAPIQGIKPEWKGRLLIKLAEDAESPSFSPDGSAVAYHFVRGRKQEQKAIGAVPKPLPAAVSGVGFVDLATGASQTLVLLQDTLPLNGVHWHRDGKWIFAYDGQTVWQVERQENKLVSREFLKLPSGRRLERLYFSPDGTSFLCLCPREVAPGLRPDYDCLLYDLKAQKMGEFAGKLPLWSADSKLLYFSQKDALCSFSVESKQIQQHFTAAYYFTHPFPAEKKPAEGYQFEIWPVAQGSENALVVSVVEIKIQAPFTPYFWSTRSYQDFWRPNGAVVNGKRTDYFLNLASSQEGRGAAFYPTGSVDTLLRLETHSLGGNPNTSVFLALTLDAARGSVLRQFDFPQSDRREVEFFHHTEKVTKKAVHHDPIYYTYQGQDAKRNLALFSYDISRSRFKEDKMTGRGFCLLNLQDSEQVRVELPNVFGETGLASLHSGQLHPASNLILFSANPYSQEKGARSIWLLDPKGQGVSEK